MRADTVARASRQGRTDPSRRTRSGPITWLAWGIWATSCLVGAAAIGFQAKNPEGLLGFSQGGLPGAITGLLFARPGP